MQMCEYYESIKLACQTLSNRVKPKIISLCFQTHEDIDDDESITMFLITLWTISKPL